MSQENTPAVAPVPLTPAQRARQIKQWFKSYGWAAGGAVAGVGLQSHGGLSSEALTYIGNNGTAVAVLAFIGWGIVTVGPWVKAQVEQHLRTNERMADSMEAQAAALAASAGHHGEMSAGMDRAKTSLETADTNARAERARTLGEVQEGRGENTTAHAEIGAKLDVVQGDLTRALADLAAIRLAMAEEGKPPEGETLTERIPRALPTDPYSPTNP